MLFCLSAVGWGWGGAGKAEWIALLLCQAKGNTPGFCLEKLCLNPREFDEGFYAAAAAAAKSLQSCLTLCDPIDGSPSGSPRPWDSPGKNPGVSCHFLLQCMKVKSES